MIVRNGASQEQERMTPTAMRRRLPVSRGLWYICREQVKGAAKMNVIWIVADTFRRDHVGAYGNPTIRTPSLDALAARSVRFDGHYAAGFPTMPTRADHHTGRWTMSFMGWEPLPAGVGYHSGGAGGSRLSYCGIGGYPLLSKGRNEL